MKHVRYEEVCPGWRVYQVCTECSTFSRLDITLEPSDERKCCYECGGRLEDTIMKLSGILKHTGNKNRGTILGTWGLRRRQDPVTEGP